MKIETPEEYCERMFGVGGVGKKWQIAILAYKAALEAVKPTIDFYADRDNWYDGLIYSATHEESSIKECDTDVENDSCFQQGGKRARETQKAMNKILEEK